MPQKKKPTVREKRKETAEVIVIKLDEVERRLNDLRKGLSQIKRFPSHNTGENRSFYRDKFKDLHAAAASALVQWDVLCALYDIVGDTKEQAW